MMILPDPSSTARLLGASDALGVAVVVALEGLCFVSAEGFLDDQPDVPVRVATVAFTGAATTGAVRITMPASLAPELFGDLADGDPELGDALGELANIVCGNFLPRMYGKGAAFVLSPPQVGDMPLPSTTAIAIIGVPGGWVSATLHPVAS